MTSSNDNTPPQAAAVTNPVTTTGGYDTANDATSVEPELPWWKQKRNIMLLVIIFVVIAVVAVILAVTLSRPPSPQSPSDLYDPCFPHSYMLKSTIDRYVQAGCSAGVDVCPAEIVGRYGWPIGSWCVDNVTHMANLFKGLDTFDEDISGWNVGQVTDMSYMLHVRCSIIL